MIRSICDAAQHHVEKATRYSGAHVSRSLALQTGPTFFWRNEQTPPEPRSVGMARYFFHVFANGIVTRDNQGIELNTLEQVELEAMSVLPEIAKDEVPLDGSHQTFTVLVTDDPGHPVYTATLNFAGLRLRGLARSMSHPATAHVSTLQRLLMQALRTER